MDKKMIEVKNVSMCFSVTNDKLMSLKEYAIAALRKKLKYKDFWVFHDISFEVEKGDVVGIIGRNGAGKSTLLKIISGVLKPTEGTVTVRGNIVPMLELGSGFDFELTGRENIFLNGSILGYDEQFLKDKYNEIVEFSELGEFIENPIRNYSSGMLMRLAFSIATIVKPEILIVDEILAVGDEAFQKKSKRKMLSLMGGGTTVLFVSHSIGQIREMCNKVAWIEDGKLRMFGETKKVCDAYQEYINPDSKINLESSKLYWNEVNKFVKDVLYVYGKREENYYWRVGIGREQLLATGITSGEVYYENISDELVRQFKVFILKECPETLELLAFIKKIKEYNKLILVDISTEEDSNDFLLKNNNLMVDGIIVSNNRLSDKYSLNYPTFINPYVASDRIAQLCTWACYDRDELPKIDPNMIDSEDMLINYNRALQEQKEHMRDGIRIGCFDGSWGEKKYLRFKDMLIQYLKKNKNTIFYMLGNEKELENYFGNVISRIRCYEKIDLENMPKIFSQLDGIICLTDGKGLNEKNYQERVIAHLVKTPCISVDISDNTYIIEKETEKFYKGERDNLAIFSGTRFSQWIVKMMKKSYAFVIDKVSDCENIIFEDIVKIAKYLYELGNDVIFISEDGQTDGIFYNKWEIPIISRTEKYVMTKYDVMIATSWRSYDFIKSYVNVVRKFYYINKYETMDYDDGDFTKFLANQTYFSENVVFLTNDEEIRKAFKTRLDMEVEKLDYILKKNNGE